MSAAVRAGTAPQSNARFIEVAALTLGVALVLPYLAISLVGGSLVRTIYPAYILAAAVLVTVNRRPLYPAFMLAVFAFSPFLRRVADYQAGFALFNLILLGPYVGLLPTLPALARRALSGGGSIEWPFAIILLCVVYAAFLAMFQLTFVAAIFEGMRWLLPAALAAFIMAVPDEADTVRRAVIQALCVIMPVLTVYGIYQFFYAPLWDVAWMMNIDNTTFGEPAAFKIRVFSMMNSPGTVAVFAAYAMLLLAGESLVALAVAAAGLPLLGLTLVRTAWLAVAVGLLVLLLRASGQRKLILIAGIIGIGFAVAALVASPSLPSDVRNLVSDRLNTFTDLGTDTSADDRLGVYDAFYSRLAESPWGEGFGANASTVSLKGAKRDFTSIDSGLMETYLVFGVLAGTLYFVAFGALIVQVWRALPVLRGRMDGNFALICSAIAILPLGSNHIGEPGVLVWTAIGTVLAGAQCARHGGQAHAKSRGMMVTSG